MCVHFNFNFKIYRLRLIENSENIFFVLKNKKVKLIEKLIENSQKTRNQDVS